MIEVGVIERPEDIYWLTQEKVEATCEKLDRGLLVKNSESDSQRKQHSDLRKKRLRR